MVVFTYVQYIWHVVSRDFCSIYLFIKKINEPFSKIFFSYFFFFFIFLIFFFFFSSVFILFLFILFYFFFSYFAVCILVFSGNEKWLFMLFKCVLLDALGMQITLMWHLTNAIWIQRVCYYWNRLRDVFTKFKFLTSFLRCKKIFSLAKIRVLTIRHNYSLLITQNNNNHINCIINRINWS